MSTADFKLTGLDAPAMCGTPTLIFWIAMLSVLPVTALFGGVRFLLLALAVGLSVIVWAHPQETPGAGMLFLFAAGIILPYGARLDVLGPIWQMYYWAVGLLLVTITGLFRIGIRRVWRVPLSAKVFFAVCLLAGLYGITHGAPASYVLRQLYGVLLLVAYFAIALSVGDQALLVRRIQSFGLFCAACFFIYYASVFTEYGFHKEMGFVSTQASLMATIMLLLGLERARGSWIVGGLCLLLIPVLLFQRGDVLTCFLALPIGVGMKVRSRRRRVACYLLAAMIALPAIFPSVAETVGQKLLQLPIIGRSLPAGVGASDTLLDRTLQLAEALSVVHDHPVLGAGMGANFSWVSPSEGKVDTEYVDSGWGYLLEKMGLLGTVAFLWFLTTISLGVSRRSAALSACLLASIVVRQFSQPAFFHFTTAPFLGSYAGLLLARQRKLRLLQANPLQARAFVHRRGLSK